MDRRRFVGALAVTPLALGAPTYAQERRPRLDADYRMIEPQPVPPGDVVEVIDFFWYGCPYCNELQPSMVAWEKRKPANVTLRHIPAVLRENWAPHARIYYTLEALGEVERLHQKVYHSYHVEELYMSRADVMIDWAVKNGIDRQKWVDAYSSVEVNGKIEQAVELTRRYRVQGTPTLIVDGRYLTSGSMASISGLMGMVDQLIRLAREQRRA